MKVVSIVIVSCVISLFTSCKKPAKPVVIEEQAENSELAAGLPGDPSALHGYLYTSLNMTSNNSYTNMYVCAFASLYVRLRLCILWRAREKINR
jgi:hypothetical protein